MCIIVVKKSGYEIPKKETLKNCFNNNSDGAGLMYVKNNKVVIDKGYMDFNSFYKRIEKLKNEIDTFSSPIIFHFRIGTSGASDGTCTHPFELTNNVKKLTRLKNEVDVGIAHNGIISTYTPPQNSKLNDTQLFIKNFLFPIYELDKNFYKNEKMQDIIKTITNSKFAILNKNSEVFTVGDFIEEDGILYSNSTYKNYYNYFSKYNDFDYYHTITSLPFYEAIEELFVLSNDEMAIDYNEEVFIPYDYRKKGKLATDYYNQLYLIDEENEKITFLSDYVEIYDTSEFESELMANERISTT